MSAWELEWTPGALREIRKLPEKDRRRIGAALHRLCNEGHTDHKKLEGEDEWRMRVGSWRVIYSKSGRVIKVLSVFNRQAGY